MKKTAYALAAAAMACVGMASAQSDTQQSRPYASLLGIYHFPDSTRLADEGYGGRLLFGIPITRYFATEVGGFITRSDNRVSGGNDHYSGAGIDLVFGPRDAGLSPFLLIGGGYHKDEIPGPNEDSGYANAGGGLLWNFGGRWDPTLRLEGRRIAIFNDDLSPGRDHIYDSQIGLGFQMALVPRAEAAPPPPPPPPPPEPVRQPPPPPPVLDSDGDGVNDDKDACPNTMRGVRVDARGCAIKAQVVELRDVTFEFDKSTLTADGRKALDEVANSLKGQPSMEISIEGHTDSVGSDAYNLRLSKARAKSVRDYLVNSGVAASRLTSEGYGETRPVASNDTAEGRAMNRRVEMKVQKE